MRIIKKNKRGVSMAELLAAIAVISVASTTITSMVITSYKGQLRAQQYVLANEVAKNIDSMLARDVTKTNISTLTDAELKEKEYVSVNDTLLQKLVKTGNTEAGSKQYGDVYYFLYPTNTQPSFELNGMSFDHTNIDVKIYVMSKGFGYFKTSITVHYQGDRQVTYDGTHFKE